MLLAAPRARELCPPAYITGSWIEVEDHIEEVTMGYADERGEFRVTLMAKPNGRMERREYDGATAPVWEIRRAEEWV